MLTLLIFNAELRLAGGALDVFKILALLELPYLEQRPFFNGVVRLAEYPVLAAAHIDVARERAENSPAHERGAYGVQNDAGDIPPYKNIGDMDKQRQNEKKAVERIKSVPALHKTHEFIHNYLHIDLSY